MRFWKASQARSSNFSGYVERALKFSQTVRGALPNKQLKLVLAWCVLHQDELMQNWELSKQSLPLNRINPLI